MHRNLLQNDGCSWVYRAAGTDSTRLFSHGVCRNTSTHTPNLERGGLMARHQSRLVSHKRLTASARRPSRGVRSESKKRQINQCNQGKDDATEGGNLCRTHSSLFTETRDRMVGKINPFARLCRTFPSFPMEACHFSDRSRVKSNRYWSPICCKLVKYSVSNVNIIWSMFACFSQPIVTCTRNMHPSQDHRAHNHSH